MIEGQDELTELRAMAAALAAYVPEQSVDNPSVERCQFCKEEWRYFMSPEGHHRVATNGHKKDCPVVVARRWT